ncbi:MAG: V-type ATPase 116kDa subunit family protein [Candidatus Micrarchaeia archaeon]
MKKVRVIVLKSQVEDLIRELHEAGLVDIRKSVHKGLDEGRPLASFDGISAALLSLRSMLAMMEPALGKGARHEEPKIIDGSSALAAAGKLDAHDRIKAINTRISDLTDRIKSLEGAEASLAKVAHLRDVDFSRLGTRTVAYRIGEISGAKIPKLSAELGKIHGEISSVPGRNVALAVFERKNEAKADSLLSEAGFTEIDLPEGTTTPSATAAKISGELRSARAGLAAAQKELVAFSHENISRVRSLIASLEVEAQRSEISSRFSESKCVYVIEGWILAESLGSLEPIVSRQKAVLEDVGFGHDHDEIPPTVLENPPLAKPFEFITRNYSFPRYNELDPTVPYFIGLSILYGMIVGDVLYGVMSLLLAYFITKRFSKSQMMSSIGMIWLISAIPTIAFGLVFDEWMGLSHFHLAEYVGSWTGMHLLSAPIYTGFHRVEGLNMLLLATLFVGMIHMGLGLILGVAGEWNHSKKHAMAKLAWLAFEAGIAMALLSQLGYIDKPFTTSGLILIGIGVVGVVMTEGAVGAVEIPGFAGNVLSYLRVAVIGVVGVILAEILNEFLRPNPSMGVLAIVLFPIYILLHLANCVIAMFEALVQGGRLNIFEFKTKFLQGGGTAFSPFASYSRKL